MSPTRRTALCLVVLALAALVTPGAAIGVAILILAIAVGVDAWFARRTIKLTRTIAPILIIGQPSRLLIEAHEVATNTRVQLRSALQMKAASIGSLPAFVRFVSCNDEMDSSNDLIGIDVPKSLLYRQKEEPIMGNDTRIAVDVAKAVFEVAISDRPGHVARRERLRAGWFCSHRTTSDPTFAATAASSADSAASPNVAMATCARC